MTNLLKRNVISVSDDGSNCNCITITVAQWNILGITNAQNDFMHIPRNVLAWQNRKSLIFEELVGTLNGADIIALQEVEAFDEILNVLKPYGFNGKFQKKPENSDGIAFFYNTNVLELVNVTELKFTPHNQVAFIVLFKVHNNNLLIFACTHLKAKASFENIREQECLMLINAIDNLYEHEYAYIPIIIAGDFNDTPDSTCCRLLKNKLYKSAYDFMPTPVYTTYKKRNDIVCRTIDYIWYKNVIPVKLLEIPLIEKIPNMLPCDNYPSDHLSILCQFNLIKK